jgi:hypothetical protein
VAQSDHVNAEIRAGAHRSQLAGLPVLKRADYGQMCKSTGVVASGLRAEVVQGSQDLLARAHCYRRYTFGH